MPPIPPLLLLRLLPTVSFGSLSSSCEREAWPLTSHPAFLFAGESRALGPRGRRTNSARALGGESSSEFRTCCPGKRRRRLLWLDLVQAPCAAPGEERRAEEPSAAWQRGTSSLPYPNLLLACSFAGVSRRNGSCSGSLSVWLLPRPRSEVRSHGEPGVAFPSLASPPPPLRKGM